MVSATKQVQAVANGEGSLKLPRRIVKDLLQQRMLAGVGAYEKYGPVWWRSALHDETARAVLNLI